MPLLPITPDLQARGQLLEQGNFVHPAGLSNGAQDLNCLSASVSSTSPGPNLMDASNMRSVETQEDPQNHQPCKYDLLSSIPRESNW